MKIIFKGINIRLDDVLKEFVLKKVSKLERLLQSQERKGGVKFIVELGKTTRHHRKGPFYFVECHVILLRKSFIAKDESDDIRVAVVRVVDELHRQIKKDQEEIIAKRRKRQRALKEKLRVSS